MFGLRNRAFASEKAKSGNLALPVPAAMRHYVADQVATGSAGVRRIVLPRTTTPSSRLHRFLAQTDHRQLPLPGHGLNRNLPLQCRTLIPANLLVDQLEGTTAAGVTGGRPGIVLLASSAHVLGDAGVERAVATTNYVNKPPTDGWLGARRAVFFRNQVSHYSIQKWQRFIEHAFEATVEHGGSTRRDDR